MVAVATNQVPDRGLIVHEWIEQRGGAEKVLLGLTKAFPAAKVLSLWNDDPERFSRDLVSETWFAKTPLRRHKAVALPLMPVSWRLGRQAMADWAVVSSHAFAHHVKVRGSTGLAPKFVYVHSPARYIWAPQLDSRGWALPVRAASIPLRRIDRRRAQEPRALAANSAFVQSRVRETWDRDAVVIHPPVDTERISQVSDWREFLESEEMRVIDALPADFLLGASRFVPYKRLDLVIRAGQVAKLPVVLAGGGPGELELRQRAQDTNVDVRFVRYPSDALLYALYQRAFCLVYPAIEDFGIIPVEAMAAGTPVLGMNTGGVSESVVDGRTGALVGDFGDVELRAGLARIERCERDQVKARAQDFSTARFVEEVRAWVTDGLEGN